MRMRKTFEKLFEEMEERLKQSESGKLPPASATERRRRDRNTSGCPEDEELCGLVDGRLKEKYFQRWLEVWRHEQVERCPACEENVRDLEDFILTPTKSAKPTTLGEVLTRAAQRHNIPNVLSHKRDGEWRSISSKELLRRARAIALGLYSLGVRRGDRVALLSENCPEWTLTDAGCQLTGMVDVAIPMNPPQGLAAQVRDALAATGARVLFISDPGVYARIEEVIDDCTTLEHVVFFDDAGADNAYAQEPRALTLAQVEARGRALDAEQPTLAEDLAQAVRPRDLATLIYTSGTTREKGQAELVMLTHENLVSDILDCFDHFAPMFYGRLFEDRSLVSLPIWHAPGRIALYVHLLQGVRIDLAESKAYAPESVSLRKICANMIEKHPTLVIGTPDLFGAIYEHITDVEAEEGTASLLTRVKASVLAWAADIGMQWADCQVKQKAVTSRLRRRQKLVSYVFPLLAMGGRVRLLISVETALPVKLAWFFKGVGLPILQGYGVTEASPVIAFGAPSDDGIVRSWQGLRNVQVRFSATNELEVHGPNVMMGYYKKPELTATVFTEDGWFRTDDSGKRVGKGTAFEFEPHGVVTFGKERIEAAIKGVKYVEQAAIESEDGKSLIAKIRLDYQRLIADKRFEALGASTEDELREDPSITKYFQEQVDSLPERQTLNNVDIRVDRSITKYFQEQVDSLAERQTLNNVDIRVDIVDYIDETATRKSLSSQGNARARLYLALALRPSFAN